MRSTILHSEDFPEVNNSQWIFPYMEQKFGKFDEFRESDKSLEHE